MPEIADQGRWASDSTQRWRRIAFWVSLVFHAALLIALGVWYAGRRNAEHNAAAHLALRQPRSKSVPQRPLPSPEVSSKQISATLERVTEKFAAEPTEKQLDELDRQAARLESLSSQKSVTEIAEKFQDWMPTSSRASEPSVEPAPGEFDFDTAQIHDVIRTAVADGRWEYRSVLIDAGGRTFEVPLEQIEGEKVYATFESLKKFPLANQVYRQIAMRLMDRALQNESTPAANPTSASPAIVEPQAALAEAVDDRDPFDDRGPPR